MALRRLLGLLLVGGRVLAQDTRYLGHVVPRAAKERVEEYVLDQEGTIFPDLVLVVAAVGEEFDQVGEPVVGGAGGAIQRVYSVGVGALVLGDLPRPEVHPLHYGIPHRGVVHPRLPGMADVDQALPPWVPVAVEVLVPGPQLAEGVLEELSGIFSGALVDGQHGGGVDGRKHHARGLAVPGGVRALFGFPEVGAGKIIPKARVEDDLGQKTVRPLGLEEVPEFFFGALAVVVGVGD